MNQTVRLPILLALLAGCGSSTVIDAPSRNQNSRVNYLVIHFTTEDFADSLSLLTQSSDNPVSSHYLIPEPFDDSYPARKLKVHRLVDESRRAWHAGKSYWGGEESLNDRSIGIELVNRSYCVGEIATDAEEDESRHCFYPDFSPRQIELLIDLAGRILQRHPNIDPVDIVGHADIAPGRKVDPGPRFPWQALHKAGIGAWYDYDTMLSYRQQFAATMPTTAVIQAALRAYGYQVEITGVFDRQSRQVVRAFQMHFRPSAVTAEIDRDTVAVLFALVEKYRNDDLDEVLEFEIPEREKTEPAATIPAG